MKFSISVVELQRVVKLFSMVVRANALDSTGRVLIDAREDGVEFVANSGVTDITCFVDSAQVEELGVTSITYNKIKSFVSSFIPWDGEAGASTFKLKKFDKTTNITVDNVYPGGRVSKAKLSLTNFNPDLMKRPKPFGTAEFSMNARIFREAASKVSYAIDPMADSTLPALQGMSMTFNEENIIFAGTNGTVLSEYSVTNESDYVNNSFILSYDFLMGLRRMITDDKQLLWELKGSRVAVKFDDVVFSGRLIVGHEYPEYKHTFEIFSDKVRLGKDVFMHVLMPLIDVLNPDDNFRLTFEIKDKNVKAFNDQANIDIELDIDGGRDFSIDVNGRLMKQVVEAINDESILMKFSDADGVLIFDSAHEENQKSLVSPLKRR